MSTRSDLSNAVDGGASLARLFRKEWMVFSYRGPFFVFGIYILAALQTVRLEEAFFLVNVALAGTLAVYVPVIEWFQESDPMLHSLPLSRNTVVVMRYLVAVVAGAVAGLAWSTTGHLLFPILSSGSASPPMWTTLDGILTFFLAVGLLFALFLPLYFRLGMGRGALMFLLSSLALLAAGYGALGLTGVPAGLGATPVPLPSDLIRMPIAALGDGLGPAGTLTAILLGTALLFGSSLKLSQRWFGKREF